MKPLSEDQKRLVQDHLPLARVIAKAFSKKFFEVPEDVLFSQACFGLIKAASRYGQNETRPFKPYARICIQGAIQDYPRSHNKFFSGLVRKKKLYPKQALFVSDDSGDPGRKQNVVEILGDGGAAATHIEDQIDAKAARRVLVRLFDKQPKLVKTLLINYYLKGWPMRLASEGRVSEGRVSQIIGAFFEKKNSTGRGSMRPGRGCLKKKLPRSRSKSAENSITLKTRSELGSAGADTMRPTKQGLRLVTENTPEGITLKTKRF